MVQGKYKEYRDENTNLVATVWNDSRPVRVLNTNARPDISYPIAHGLIAGFTSRKRQSNVLQRVRPEIPPIPNTISLPL